MAKRRRLASHHAVGASLAPKSQQEYIAGWFDEQGKRQGEFNSLQDQVLADPLERQKIALGYVQGVGKRATSLASRGLAADGFDAGDIADIERARVTAEEAQNIKISTAKARYTAAIQSMNSQRTATDKAFAAEAGQNVQAGTGRYAHEHPAGWRPPSLGPAAPTYGSAPTTAAPQPAAPAKPATVAPTGARLATSKPPSVLGSVVHGAPKLAVGYAKRKTRLA